MTLVSFAAAWFGGAFRERVLLELDTHRARLVSGNAQATPDLELDVTLIPTLTDHHVHLGLIDPAALFAQGITDAVDLGWIPEIAQTWTALDAPRVRVAGALLTCVDGYPKNAGWAPPGSTVEVHDPAAADAAVAEQYRLGASVIKITLNSEAGPVPDDPLLGALVAAAHRRRLSVYAHAQGAGQAERALAAGVDVLAHAPFSEPLPEATLVGMVTAGMVWVSTLDIHGWGHPLPEFSIALDNVRRFAAAGGRVVYGTDAGNGPLPVGVNGRELAALAEAGFGPDALVATIAAGRAAGGGAGGSADDPGASAAVTAGATLPPHVAIVPGTPPRRPEELPDWLATARGCSVEDLRTRGAL